MKPDPVERGFKTIMSTEAGRAWLRHFVFNVCHVNQRSHVPGDPDSTAYNDAVRMVGQAVLEDVRVYTPNQYGAFMQDAIKDHS